MILHLDGKRIFQGGLMRVRGADPWSVIIDVAGPRDSETGEAPVARLAISREEIETLCAAAKLNWRA
jgi:hypothetical protein